MGDTEMSVLDSFDQQDGAPPLGVGEEPPIAGEEGGEQQKKATVRRPSRRVTADLLCSTNGLEKLAKISRDPGVFKRSGSVAKDVRRVIQIYEGWARQLLPTVQFAQFVQQAENLSGNQKVQVKQMHLDQGYDDTWADTSVDAAGSGGPAKPQDDWGDVAPQGLDEEPPPSMGHGNDSGGGSSSGGNASDHGLPAHGDDGIPDEDELMMMQLEAEEAEAGGAYRPPSPPPQLPAASSALSDDLKAKIEANRRRAMERRKASQAAAAMAAH